MHATYITECFDRKQQDKVIREIKVLLKKHNVQFDGFVVTGVSGIAMGSILARMFRKDLVIVRKDNDGSHSSFDVENYKSNKRYIFLDDLVSSGVTYRRVVSKLDEAFKSLKTYYYYRFDPKFDKKSKIIGQLLYAGSPIYKKVAREITKTYQFKTKI